MEVSCCSKNKDRKKTTQKKVRKDQKIDNWLNTLTTLNDMGRDRAMRNVNERINSSDPTMAREKAEIAAFNKEYDAQAGWRDSIDGIGLEGYAQPRSRCIFKSRQVF